MGGIRCVVGALVLMACGDDGGGAPRDGRTADGTGDTLPDTPSGPGCETPMVCGAVGSGPPAWVWDKPLASTMSMLVIDAAMTPSGGVVVAGQYEGDVNLGGIAQTAVGGFDAFILALDANGNYRWHRAIATPGDDLVASVVVDSCGNVYASGSFGGAFDFGSGSRTITGLADGFLVSYAPDGTYRWDTEYRGSAAAIGDRATALGIDAGDQLVVAGRFGGDIDLGLGLATGAANIATFVAGVDLATGKATWNTFLRSTTGVEPFGIAIDSAGAPTVTGRFAGSVDFGGGTRTAAGGNDAYAVRFDAAHAYKGDVVWGGAMTDQVITAAASGTTIAIGGTYRDVTTFDGRMLTAVGSYDSLLAGIDESGALTWDKQWVGAGADGIAAFATTSAGDFVANGAVVGSTVNFGGADRTTAAGASGCALVGYGADGAYRWDEFLGGTAAGSCIGVGIGAGRCGRIVAVGQYQGTVDFGGGTRTATGTVDAFVLLVAQ